MTDMMNTICGWTGSKTGQVVVGASVLALGMTHFGWAGGITSFSIGPISVGTVAGWVGVIFGSCVLWNAFTE